MSVDLGVKENNLKVCPVCHAQCFADMDICYGCLHKFSDKDSTQDTAQLKVVCKQDELSNTPTSNPIRLNDLLEIVISVRMAQDAKKAALHQSSLQENRVE